MITRVFILLALLLAAFPAGAAQRHYSRSQQADRADAEDQAAEDEARTQARAKARAEALLKGDEKAVEEIDAMTRAEEGEDGDE
jgi:hypothetical protein